MKLKEQIADTELKLMLDSKRILEKKETLNDDFMTLFKFDDDVQFMSVWYLDTPEHNLRKAGWSVRYRQRDDESGFELTFKKRYGEKGYRSMLDTKYAPLFAGEFKPEIDMTYTKKTYSLSFEILFSDETDLDEPEAKRLAILNSPSVFTNWKKRNDGFCELCDAKLFGPVKATTYKGRFEGHEAKLEIWRLKDTLSEISFDVPTKKSTDLKRSLLKTLSKDHWLLPVNTLKTDAFFDYYAKGDKPKD